MGLLQRFETTRIDIYFFKLQEPLIGQLEQPHPQEDFPFFLFSTIEIIIAKITKAIISPIIIVAKFSYIHANI